MIVDIPTPADFHGAGLRQVHLAWQIAMGAVHDFDEATYYKLADETELEAAEDFWQRSQPALANAYSLIQHAMELALKGRIAQITPYLLIGGPKDWPRGTATSPISFGEFRTLDATDLVLVHDSVASVPFDDPFKIFWEQIRRDRNKIMHSAAPGTFMPAQVIRTLLTAIRTLFNDVPWPKRLLQLEHESKFASLGVVDDAQNNVLRQIDTAIRHLKPAEAKQFFGFDDDRRGYVCPHCYFASNRDWQDDWPHLAQLTRKERGATELYCFVCEQTTTVTRQPCGEDDCKGDVVTDDICLTCTHRQDECFSVASGLTDAALDDGEHTYRFIFRRGTFGSGGYSASDRRYLLDDAAAVEHAAIALRAPHLQSWNIVVIRQEKPATDLHDMRGLARVLGFWQRVDGDLVWHDGPSDDPLMSLPL